jgi:P4 family phage/plasmid primase-like protien
MTTLLEPLSALAAYNQFILCRLSDKVPLSHQNLKPANALDCQNWLSLDSATKRLTQVGKEYRVGFVLTAGDPFCCIDIDNCIDDDGNLNEVALDLLSMLPSAAIEYSQSGKGLHLWFSYRGKSPKHSKKNTQYNIECYTGSRYILLTGDSQAGNANLNLTYELNTVITKYFPPHSETSAVSTTVIQIHQDQEIIASISSARGGPATIFGTKATAAQLWNNDEEALAKAFPAQNYIDPYDRSSADMALASHLAYHSKGSTEQVIRLMWKSGLSRGKWNNHKSYLADTVTKAVNGYSLSTKNNENISNGNQPTMVNETIQLMGAGNVIYTNGSFWAWSDGVWSKVDDHYIRKNIHTAFSERYSSSKVENILKLIKTELFKPNHIFNINPDVINTINGELAYIAGKWILSPHNRENYFTTQIPVTYEPESDAPRFKQFLNEIFNNDSDSQEKINVVLEMMGYSLMSTNRHERFIILIGEGANGKSVLMNIMAELLGKDNICAVQPSKLENTFQRAHLDGKLANIITEVAVGAKIPDAQLKSIVSGELTTAEHKGKDPFDFKPIATCWFGTNHMPHTSDFSQALFRRAIIVSFNNQFSGASQDSSLTEKLKLELPGILNLALAAGARILDSGEISTCESSESAKREWRHSSDQVSQFIDAKCICTPGEKTAISTLFSTYFQWAQQEGIKYTLTQTNFGKRLERFGYPKVRGTGGTWHRTGIALKINIDHKW